MTTGETADNWNVDGTRVSSISVDSPPACVFREEEAHKPLMRPVGPQVESVVPPFSPGGAIAAQESS